MCMCACVSVILVELKFVHEVSFVCCDWFMLCLHSAYTQKTHIVTLSDCCLVSQAHILQQITTRVQVRISLDKTEFKGLHLHNVGYSSEATASIIRNIAGMFCVNV